MNDHDVVIVTLSDDQFGTLAAGYCLNCGQLGQSAFPNLYLGEVSGVERAKQYFLTDFSLGCSP